jgi:hypothetical protein
MYSLFYKEITSMATKKTSLKKATPAKKSSTSSVKTKKTEGKKAENGTPIAAKSVTTKSVTKSVKKKTVKTEPKPVKIPLEKTVKIDMPGDSYTKPTMLTRESLISKNVLLPSKKTKIQSGFFAGYQQVEDRIFLSNPKTYGEIPDLLELQKKGYADFLEIYLPKLFDDVNPIWDIGGNHLNVTISSIKVSEPIENVETCKKKELTYGGIITAQIKLVEMVEDEKTKKKSEKVLFSKRANVGILPVMTPSATYIINGVERVIISQIVRSYGIFYSKKEGRFSCKLIPENGPWLEIDVEKFGTIVARINKSRKFPITALFRVF